MWTRRGRSGGGSITSRSCNLGGTFGTLEGSWEVSEVLGVGGETVWDFDLHQQARSVIGATLRHGDGFATYGELRYINSQDQTYANVGAHYELSRKYSVTATGSYDTVRHEFQTMSLDVRRRLPNVVVGMGVSYNNITGVTSFGLSLQPVRVAGPGVSVRPGP